MHIVDCVFRHSSRQRTFCPIGFLRALRQFQTEIAFHPRSETKFANTKETRCNQRIENRVRAELQTEPQHSQIVIGAMQNNFPECERLAQWLQIETSQRIHNEVVVAAGADRGWQTHLEQTKFLPI